MDRLTIRRKLLRGSLSAPLVLTVASASAWTNTRTTFEACITATQGRSGEAYRQTADGLYRKSAPTYKFVRKIYGTEMPGPYVKDNYKYFRLSDLAEVAKPYGYDAVQLNNNALQLVYFNSSGSEVGYGFDTDCGGYPVSTSCHTSLALHKV